jgi:hypothetical protein
MILGTEVMAADDANVPPATADQNGVSRNCEKCSASMKRLGVLPALSIRAAISVFRCNACDHVAADPI